MTVLSQDELTREDKRRIREREAQTRKLCRAAPRYRCRLDRLFAIAKSDRDRLVEAADRLHEGRDGCPRDEEQAIAILDHVVGPDPLSFGNAEIVASLARYLAARGQAADILRVAELGDVLWLLNSRYGARRPDRSAEERRAFVARGDVWRWLEERASAGIPREVMIDALLDPLSPRTDAPRAIALLEAQPYASEEWLRAARLLLSGGAIPVDAARAERLLVRAAPYQDGAAQLLVPILEQRLRSTDAAAHVGAVAQLASLAAKSTPAGAISRTVLAPVFIEQLGADNIAVRAAASDALTSYAELGTQSVAAPLLRWSSRALARGDEAEKAAAWRNLARLRRAGVAGADKAMAAAFARGGGLVAGGRFTASQVKSFVTVNDYPSRALREEVEGIVEIDVIFAPDGRALDAIVTRSAAPALDRMVVELALRRLRLRDIPALAGPSFEGRYVRVTLPPVQFRLIPCSTGAGLSPAVAGAMTVNAVCRMEQAADVVVSN